MHFLVLQAFSQPVPVSAPEVNGSAQGDTTGAPAQELSDEAKAWADRAKAWAAAKAALVSTGSGDAAAAAGAPVADAAYYAQDPSQGE